MLWECKIRGRGVRSRTTAGASSSDSWTNQMGRPKPGATMEIGNQRRIPAIRKTQKTEAEDHKMQDNKGQTKRFFEGRSESIRMETGEGGEAKERFSSLQAASNNGFSAASHCRMNNGSAGLDEQPSLEKNSEKPCHLERNWLLTYSKTTLVRKILLWLYRHGCLQDKS